MLKPFIDICLLRANPQDLPQSNALLGIALAVYFFAGVLLSASIYGFALSLLQTGVDIALLSGYTLLVLHITAHRERYIQTLTALAGTGTILTVVAIPLSTSISHSAAGGEPVTGMIGLGYLLLMVWLLVVYGHIFRHALSKGLPMGLLASFGYLLMGSLVIELVLPGPAAS